MIRNTLFYSAFIFTAKRLPVPITLSIMLCHTVPSLASITRSYFHFTVPITCTVWMSPTPSRASLVRYLLYTLKRIGHKHHPCLTLLPSSPSLLFPWPILNLTLIHVRYIDQSSFAPLLPVCFGTCCNLVQKQRIKLFTCSNTLTTFSVINAEIKEKTLPPFMCSQIT